MGDIRNIYLTITAPRKKITSPSLLIVTSELQKNRRIKFKNLYVTLLTLFNKLPKKKLLLVLKVINLNIFKFLINSLKRIRFY